jgi:hypothetical protein
MVLDFDWLKFQEELSQGCPTGWTYCGLCSVIPAKNLHIPRGTESVGWVNETVVSIQKEGLYMYCGIPETDSSVNKFKK